MIYLYTGQPGTGKTLNSLKKLVELSENSARPVYVCGVKLTDSFPVRYKELTYDNLEIWPDIIEDNAVVFIDEAQKLFRPRSSSSKVPLYVSELETHRHRGLDFIIVTQYPNLLDSHLAGLVGQHVHVGLSPLGQRRLLIWDRQASPRVKSDVQEAKKVFQKLPTEVFPWYVSSVENRLHTAKRSYVKLVLVATAILLLLSALGFVFALSSTKDGVKDSIESSTGTVKPTKEEIAEGVASSDTNKDDPKEKERALSEEKEERVIHKEVVGKYFQKVDNEWERDVYEGGIEPYDSPVPAGCVASSVSCNCYSHKGRKLVVAKKLCVKIANGERLPFDYRNGSADGKAAVAPPVLPSGLSGVSMPAGAAAQ